MFGPKNLSHHVFMCVYMCVCLSVCACAVLDEECMS